MTEDSGVESARPRGSEALRFGAATRDRLAVAGTDCNILVWDLRPVLPMRLEIDAMAAEFETADFVVVSDNDGVWRRATLGFSTQFVHLSDGKRCHLYRLLRRYEIQRG